MARVSEVQVGSVFGRLTVAAYSNFDKPTRVRKVISYCECGGVKVSMLHHLGKNTLSCGCLEKTHRVTHGGSGTVEYTIWNAMWDRCTNPSNKKYQEYQHRTPPESWRDFAIFLKDMGPRPSSKHSIERRENLKPYGPENCYWATAYEQANNKANNTLYTDGTQVLSLAQIARLTGANYKTLDNQIRTMRWPVARALGPSWSLYRKGSNVAI